MLTRSDDVKEGSVTIDGESIRNVTLHSLRTEIGVLIQEPFVFKRTVIDNIRYSKWDATDERLVLRAGKMI